jgi:hypothetical protein
MFDKILLINRLGEQVYFGSIQGSVQHLNSVGFPSPDQVL